MGLLAGCNRPDAPDCLRTVGPPAVRTYPLAGVRTLWVQDNVAVTLTNQPTTEARVAAGANLIDRIRVEQRGDTLRLSNANRCNWARDLATPVRVTLGGAGLRTLRAEGYGELRTDGPLTLTTFDLRILEGNPRVELDLRVDTLTVLVNCSPELILRGAANYYAVWSREYGQVRSETLQAQTCVVRNSSANQVRVFPVQRLQARVERSGDVIYYHEPASQQVEITGTGRVIRR